MARRLLLGLLLCAFAPLGLAQGAGDGKSKKPKRPPPPVVVVTAERVTLSPVTWYPGTVISRNQANIAAEVPGRIEWVAEVGTMVKAGEPVARLDAVLLKQSLAEYQAQISRERARLTFLDAEVKRLDRLVKRRTATRSQLDEAISQRGVTRSELAAAQARMQLTNERVARTEIRAPFAAVVAERVLQAGEWADDGRAVVRLVDTESLEVQTWIPVQSLAYVTPGNRLDLTASPAAGQGVVRTLVPVGDDRSRLYDLRLTLTGQRWAVGQSVRVAVPTGASKDVIAVDRDALVLRKGRIAVFRIDGEDKAERVPIETGIASGSLIEVIGVNEGDRVVIRGGERLRPGTQVRVVPRAGKPKSS